VERQVWDASHGLLNHHDPVTIVDQCAQQLYNGTNRCGLFQPTGDKAVRSFGALATGS
jgi:hypothetical protein